MARRYGRGYVKPQRIAPLRELPLTWDEWSSTLSFTVTAGGGSSLTRTVTDTVALVSDAVTRLLTLARTATDTITGSDSISRVLSAARTLTDTVTGSESVSAVIAIIRSLTDTVTGSDSVARLLSTARTLTDTTTLSEAVTRVVSAVRSLTDTTTLSDSVARVISAVRTLADTLSLSESVARAKTLFRTLDDRIGIFSVTGRLGAFLLGRRESGLGRDTIDAVEVDVVAQTRNVFRTALDTLTGFSDSVSRLWTGARSALDTLTTIAIAIVGRIFATVRIRDEARSTVSMAASQPPTVATNETEPGSITLSDYQE